MIAFSSSDSITSFSSSRSDSASSVSPAFAEHPARRLVRFGEDALHLGVDLQRGFLGVVAALGANGVSRNTGRCGRCS